MAPARQQPDPVSGSRVMVTRTPERSVELVGLLRARGARPILVPLQEAEPVDGEELTALRALLDQAVRVGRHDGGHDGRLWLALTSANTVRALDRIARAHHGLGLGRLLGDAGSRGLRIAAVGPATARALREEGVPVDLVPFGASSAEGLLETWAQPAPGGPGPGPGTVLLPQSAAARPRLADGLEGLGWRVERVVAYRMAPWPAAHSLTADQPLDGGQPLSAVQPEDQPVWTLERAHRELAAGGVDAVILTAPSALRLLAGQRPALLARPRLVAIGEPTRRAARALGLEILESAGTEPADLVAALSTALTTAVTAAPTTAPTAPPAGAACPGGPTASPTASSPHRRPR